MFNSAIVNPVSPLTTTYINKLVRINNDPDFSLISLATAIIKPRVETYSGIEGSYLFTRDANDIANKIDLFNDSRKNVDKKAAMNIPAFFYMISNLSMDSLNVIRAHAKEIGLTELTTIENFVNQQLSFSTYGVFINSESNAAFVVVSSTSMSLYHLSISFISLLYPALFKEHPLTKEETEVLKGLTNKSQTNFVERTSDILQYMKADLLRQELAECFRGFRT